MQPCTPRRTRLPAPDVACLPPVNSEGVPEMSAGHRNVTPVSSCLPVTASILLRRTGVHLTHVALWNLGKTSHSTDPLREEPLLPPAPSCPRGRFKNTNPAPLEGGGLGGSNGPGWH